MPKELIIWPEYFDSTLPRRLGRRVPKHQAIPHPTIKDLIDVCRELNLECEVYKDKKYPRMWHSSKGCIKVLLRENRMLSKNEVLRLIAGKLVELKSASR
ncbi:MAG: signal recognition particle subunit SRP19/SEC65 family protein [Desulfurococcales archaeon]|nr:signal recognition particle subunit SRP19/SEC65 family protein [Desulfurococcales archaeon]